MARFVLIVSVLFAALAGVAIAAPPWSPPENVSSPSLFVSRPNVTFDSEGRALATWRWSGPRPQGGEAPEGWKLAVREPGAAEFGPERNAPDFAAAPVAYALSRMLALDQRQRGGSEDAISLRARFGRTTTGTFGRPQTISSFTQTGAPPSLSSPTGAVAAWIAKGSRGRRVVRAATRRENGGFARPVTLRGTGRANDVVAGEGLGVLVVAWERAGVIEARVKLSRSRSWSRVQRLGEAVPFATTFRVLFAGRRGYVAWLAQSAESAVLRAAVFPAGGTRFQGAQTVDTIDHEAPAEEHPPALASIPERDALLAWTDWDGARWRVRAAVTGAGARFGAPLDVSPAGENAVLGDAAAIPRGTGKPEGTVLATWSRLDAVGELGDRVRAAVRPPGAAFGAPEDVSDLDRARLPIVAFDFKSERWTALWSQRMGPDQGVPQAQIQTFARGATRPGT